MEQPSTTKRAFGQPSGSTDSLPDTTAIASEGEKKPVGRRAKHNRLKREKRRTRKDGHAETFSAIVHNDEIQELFIAQQEAMETHLASTNFSPEHEALIRRCFEGSAQLDLWDRSDAAQQQRILKLLRAHYGPNGTEDNRLMVHEDLQSLRIFEDHEVDQALDEIKAAHRRLSRQANRDAGANLVSHNHYEQRQSLQPSDGQGASSTVTNSRDTGLRETLHPSTSANPSSSASPKSKVNRPPITRSVLDKAAGKFGYECFHCDDPTLIELIRHKNSSSFSHESSSTKSAENPFIRCGQVYADKPPADEEAQLAEGEPRTKIMRSISEGNKPLISQNEPAPRRSSASSTIKKPGKAKQDFRNTQKRAENTSEEIDLAAKLKIRPRIHERCKKARTIVEHTTAHFPNGLSFEELEEMHVYAILGMQRIRQTIKASTPDEKVKLYLLQHHRYDAFWTTFYRKRPKAQQVMFRQFREKFAHYREEDIRYEEEDVADELNTEDVTLFDLNEMHNACAAINDDWTVSLPLRLL